MRKDLLIYVSKFQIIKMTIEQFKTNVVEYSQQTINSNMQMYHYNVCNLIYEFGKFEQILSYAKDNLFFIKKQLGQLYAKCVLIANDLNFPLNSKEFSLDIFKNQIRNMSVLTTLEYSNAI